MPNHTLEKSIIKVLYCSYDCLLFGKGSSRNLTIRNRRIWCRYSIVRNEWEWNGRGRICDWMDEDLLYCTILYCTVLYCTPTLSGPRLCHTAFDVDGNFYR